MSERSEHRFCVGEAVRNEERDTQKGCRLQACEAFCVFDRATPLCPAGSWQRARGEHSGKGREQRRANAFARRVSRKVVATNTGRTFGAKGESSAGRTPLPAGSPARSWQRTRGEHSGQRARAAQGERLCPQGLPQGVFWSVSCEDPQKRLRYWI